MPTRDTDAEAPVDTFTHTSVRMPSGLRDKLTREAARNKRTLSHEIIQRLEVSLEAGPPKAAHSQERVDLSRSQATHVAETSGTSYSIPKIAQDLSDILQRLTPDQQLALLVLLRR